MGFQGGMRKVGTQPVPHYFVMVGGVVNESGASFARTAVKIPARRIPAALKRLIGLYQAEHVGGETATAFFGRVPPGGPGRRVQCLTEMLGFPRTGDAGLQVAGGACISCTESCGKARSIRR